MKVLVIGANGKVGRHVARTLQESDHEPVAMVRDTDQVPWFEEQGIKTVLGNLESNFEEAFYGIDGVIFAAGSGPHTGPDKTIIIDQEGAIKSIELAEQFGVSRFIMLSSMNADKPEQYPAMKHYLFAKHRADDYLRKSRLNYTIIRPGGLTNEEGTGKVRLEESIPEGGTIPRADVAKVLVYLLSVPRAEFKSFDLIRGTDELGEVLAY
ncbi:SDR family oxidoreductase [Sediminibacillus massiliensis]|uniref:SDR family oxidoreductase n=1 Tax=Sediminibacillus massiliensis TaxID=1926277 RepID=UPI0009882FD5|nr:SDR family oxidoreductase [Sediminibacillus massiliensis]